MSLSIAQTLTRQASALLRHQKAALQAFPSLSVPGREPRRSYYGAQGSLIPIVIEQVSDGIFYFLVFKASLLSPNDGRIETLVVIYY
jgi:predicted ATPase